MDMRTPKWHAQLQLSGVGKPINISGSLATILGSAIRELQTVRPRQIAGGQEINLMIRDKPFNSSEKESESDLAKLLEISEQLDSSDSTRDPLPSESFGEYYQYLINTGISPIAADSIAREWFQMPRNETVYNWQTDPKAKRFRKLNYVQSEFDKALPGEYLELKRYVTQTYPTFAAHMQFRIA
jgi:hypothetical protein